MNTSTVLENHARNLSTERLRVLREEGPGTEQFPSSSPFSLTRVLEFLKLLSDIAITTRQTEPRTLAYGWFQSTGDNSEVPNRWVRGLEVYEDEEALTITHRSSAPYKKMRSSVIPEKILSEPTDLRFLRPTGIGFLNKSGGTILFSTDDSIKDEQKDLIAVIEIRPKENRREALLRDMKEMADHIEVNEPETGSFWALEYLPEYSESGLVIFSRFENSSEYQKHIGSPKTVEIR